METLSILSSWPDAKAYLLRRFPTARDHDDAVGLTWKATEPGLAPLRLRVTPGGEPGDPRLLVTATLFSEHRLGARDLLAFADRMPLGGVALNGDTYLFRQALLLAGLAPEALARSVELIARAAAQLLRLVAPRPQHAELFANYA